MLLEERYGITFGFAGLRKGNSFAHNGLTLFTNSDFQDGDDMATDLPNDQGERPAPTAVAVRKRSAQTPDHRGTETPGDGSPPPTGWTMESSNSRVSRDVRKDKRQSQRRSHQNRKQDECPSE